MIAQGFEVSLADAAGLAAGFCLITCPMFTSRAGIVLAQLGVSVFFALHYWLVGADTAAVAGVLGAVQTVAALLAPRYSLLNKAGYALIAVMVAFGLSLWAGPTSGLATAAMAFIAFARMRTDEVELRLFLLCGSVLWTAHDALIGSWIALTADVLSGLIGLCALVAIHRRGGLSATRLAIA